MLHFFEMLKHVHDVCLLLSVSLGVVGCSLDVDAGSGNSGGAATPGVAVGGGSSDAQASNGGGDPAGTTGTTTGGSSGAGGSGNGAGGVGGTATGGSGTGGTPSGGSSAGGTASSGTSAGGSASGGSSSADPYGDARTRCVNRTNELRATKGLAPIPILSKAESCVDGQAKADSISGMAHSAFSACLDQVDWKGAGQNECPNYGSVEATLTKCLDAMWAEGPGGGHYDNMVGGATHTACGFYTTPAGKVWMVQDFWTE